MTLEELTGHESGIVICHADPNWSAPCEYDDEEDE